MNFGRMNGETYCAKASDGRGNVTARFYAETFKLAMHRADVGAPDASYVTVRGEYTSDGTRFENHGGRLLASREYGRWLVG
jgi:hypothetical protein